MKKIINFIKELRKKPYGKSVMFFGFYLIFFLVIGLIFLLGGSSEKVNSNSDTTTMYKSLFNDNYSFTYKVELDGEKYIYSVNKNNSNYNFIYDNKEYSIINNETYVGDSILQNPIKFNDLFDENILLEILNNSYRESRTIYDNGDEVYDFLLSSNVLDKVLYDKNTDYDEIPNKLKLSVDNKKIKEINYSLDSYCKLNDLCKKSLNINIEYMN